MMRTLGEWDVYVPDLPHGEFSYHVVDWSCLNSKRVFIWSIQIINSRGQIFS